MTELQPNPLNLARQGNSKAIAALINQSLQPQGILAKVVLREGTLKVLLESALAPDEAILVPFVRQGIEALNLAQVETLQIIGRVQGAAAPAWTKSLPLRSPITETDNVAENNIGQNAENVLENDIEKISIHLNQAIASEGMIFLADLAENILKITVKTDRLLEADVLAKSIREQLLPLNLKNIAAVHIYKQKTKSHSGYKIKEFAIAPEPAATSEPSKSSVASVDKSLVKSRSQTSSSSQSNTGSPNKLSRKLPLLLIAGLVTILFVVSVRFLSTPPTLKQSCAGAVGSPQECQLAVQLAGAQTFQDSKEEAIAFTPKLLDAAIGFCGDLALNNNKQFAKRSKTRTISAQKSTELFDGVVLVDIQTAEVQTRQVTASRLACVLQNTKERPPIALVASDFIPNNWSQSPYQPSPNKLEGESVSRSLKVYKIFIELGAFSLFTAVGLGIVAILNLGMQFYSLKALVQTAFVLGTVETFMSMIPGLAIVGGIPFTSVALLITSYWVKDLRIDWATGYRQIAGSVLVIIAIRWFLSWLLLGAILAVI